MSTYDDPTQSAMPPAPTPPRPPVRPTPPPVETPEGTPFPMVVALLFVGVLIGSWFLQGSGAAPAAPTAAPAPSEGEAPPAAVEAPAPAPTPAVVTGDELKAVKDELATLARQVAEMPKAAPAPAVDLKPIEEKIDGLARTTEAAAALPKTIEELSGKLAQAEEKMGAITAEVASIRESLKARPEPAPTPAAATPAPAAEPAKDMAAMNSAVDLFKAGKYAEALDAFKALPADDARVLYYTALATGQATRTWTGETEKLALRGVDREKAGSPATPEVDAAFAGLTDQQGKAWLTFYRAKAK